MSSLQEEVFMNGTIVLPHKEIKESNLDPGTIIMWGEIHTEYNFEHQELQNCCGIDENNILRAHWQFEMILNSIDKIFFSTRVCANAKMGEFWDGHQRDDLGCVIACKFCAVHYSD